MSDDDDDIEIIDFREGKLEPAEKLIASKLKLELIASLGKGKEGTAYEVFSKKSQRKYVLKVAQSRMVNNVYSTQDHLQTLRTYFLTNEYSKFFVHVHKWGVFTRQAYTDNGKLTSFPGTEFQEGIAFTHQCAR